MYINTGVTCPGHKYPEDDQIEDHFSLERKSVI